MAQMGDDAKTASIKKYYSMGLSISYLGDLGGYDTQVTKENKSHGSDKKKNRVKQRLVSPE